MTTISRKTFNDLDWQWKRRHLEIGTVTGYKYFYYIKLAGKFREVALVD